MTKKMQLDVGSEPPFRFAYIKCIDKHLDMVNKSHCFTTANYFLVTSQSLWLHYNLLVYLKHPS